MQHRALGAARVVLVAAAAVLLVTCTEPTTGPRITQGPSFAISDGASGGNQDVFFLPPLTSSPHGSDYGDRPPNPNLHPFAKVCTLNATEANQAPTPLECLDPDQPADVDSFPMTYDASGQFYSYNWQTSNTPLDTNSMYRIQIFVGAVSLAFRDVDPDPGPPRGSCKTSDDFCQFQNGSNVAIKVRIETDAVCIALDPSFDPSTQPCATATLDAGGSLSLSDLSVASVDQGTTLNMQPCGDFRQRGLVDLRTFGECVSIADLDYVPGVTLGVTGTATLCHAYQLALDAGLSPEQAGRMTVHRFSAGVVYAEPHAEAGDCSTLTPTLGMKPEPSTMSRLQHLASGAWHAAADRLRTWVEASPLWAAPLPPCHAATCGSVTVFESEFEVALPAWMAFDPSNPGGATSSSVWDLGTYNSGATVVASIKVVDSGEPDSPPNGDPVADARLTVHSVGGSVSQAGTPCATGDDRTDLATGDINICTGADGIARFTLTAGPGSNSATVSGHGVGTADAPGTVNNVFAPSESATDVSDQVPLGVGTLTFTATGLVPLYFNPDPPSGSKTLYTDANGEAWFPNFDVCTNPASAGVEIESLEAVTNNGTYKDLDNLPAHPWVTGTNGCYTFSGVTILGTGAFHLEANGQYASLKFNVKPGH